MRNKYIKPEILTINISLENCITAASANVITKDNTIVIEWEEEEENQVIDW